MQKKYVILCAGAIVLFASFFVAGYQCAGIKQRAAVAELQRAIDRLDVYADAVTAELIDARRTVDGIIQRSDSARARLEESIRATSAIVDRNRRIIALVDAIRIAVDELRISVEQRTPTE